MRSYGFIDFGGKHYSITFSQQQTLASAMSNGEFGVTVGDHLRHFIVSEPISRAA